MLFVKLNLSHFVNGITLGVIRLSIKFYIAKVTSKLYVWFLLATCGLNRTPGAFSAFS